MRLCSLGATYWPQISAYYHASRTPLLRMPSHEYLNMVYSWLIERVPHDKLDDWLTELHDLLPWQDADSEAAIEMESEAFMKMMSKG